MHIPTYFLFGPAFNTGLNKLLCLYTLMDCVCHHEYFKGTVILDVNRMKACSVPDRDILLTDPDPRIRYSE
jgi:hypothetical protein